MRKVLRTWSTPPVPEDRRFEACPLCGGDRFVSALDCGAYGFSRCGKCGLLRQQPLPSAQAVERRYRDAHGEDYLAYELENETKFLALQDLALGDIGFRDLEAGRSAPGRFLDVGCATGALLEELRGRAWETAGIELCGPSAAWARERRSLDIFEGDIADAPWQDGRFDVVHASHLIEHLRDPGVFVREARRLLVPGGVLLVTTPNVDGFQSRLFGSRWRSAIFDHLTLFSKRTLRALLESEGFSVEREATWGGLAVGSAPTFLKRIADRAVKPLGIGDVVMMWARAPRG